MHIYLYPILQALRIFPIVLAVVLLPFMFFQYRRYGAVSGIRSLVLYSFIFYLLAAYFITILPLPDRNAITTHYRDMMQLVPFQFVADFFKKTSLVISDPSTYLRALLQNVIIQPVFNVVLTIPFGIYLRYYFKRTFKETVFASFGLALFFELTQLSGLYGYYSGPYRLFDVDDLILNTLGGILGYALSPSLTFFFPSRERIDTHSYQKGIGSVTYIRRLYAYLIDYVFLVFINFLITALLRWLGLNMPSLWLDFFLFMTYFALIPYLFKSATPGQRAVRIHVVSTKGTLNVFQLFLRALCVYVIFDQGPAIFNTLSGFLTQNENIELIPLLIVLGLQAAWYLFLVIHICYTAFEGQRILFYERLSTTRMESTIQEPIGETI